MKSKLVRIAISGLICLALANGAWGQSKGGAEEEEEPGKSYVTSYFIVGLGITLGLVAILKSSGRRKKIRAPEE